MADPAGRFSVGFDNLTLDWDVTWTALDQVHPNLITSYQIDRGRQFELDRTDGGRARVEVIDPDGILDPTNAGSPYYGQLEPLLPAAIARRNPVTGVWFTRFRGFIQEFDYTYDPSQRLGRLTLELIDLYEILNAIQMTVADFGHPGGAPEESKTEVWFQGEPSMDDRIITVLNQAHIPDPFTIVFSGNVELYPTVYTPGESVMTVIQEAADAEFPSVSNVYVDRLGRIVFHGRLAKFDPNGVEAGAPGLWDFREFTAGDRQAVGVLANCAQIRRFAFNRGLSKIINHASATPWRPGTEDDQLTEAERIGQVVTDTGSISQYGWRSWSAENLLTFGNTLDTTNDLQETKKFAQYHVDNYKQPRNRITDIAFRSMIPGEPGATATWNLMSRVDISDSVAVTVHGAGGGLFDGETFFVEGVHEECRPLNPTMDDVTLSLDLSPRAYYESNPF